eukprot:805056-Ditylum_brightwellii.AAC.1
MLAKLGRVIMIADELRELASATKDKNAHLKEVIHEVEIKSDFLPTDEEFHSAISQLLSSVEIWINGTAEAKFVYDSSYSGLVNCGCLLNWNGYQLTCMNEYPDCPAFKDPGLNFGNGGNGHSLTNTLWYIATRPDVKEPLILSQ